MLSRFGKMRGSLKRRFEQAFWDFHSRGYDSAAEASGPFEREITEWIGGPVDGGRVLVDLGCGTGRLLASLSGAGWYAVGADVSPGMLRRAASRIPATGVGGLVRLDLNQPLPFDEVNQVILIHSLQVVRAPGAMLRRVHEILVPGGRVLVVVKKEPSHPGPTRHPLIRRLKQIAGATGWIRSFPADRLSVSLRELGFHILEDRSTEKIAAVMAAKGRS